MDPPFFIGFSLFLAIVRQGLRLPNPIQVGPNISNFVGLYRRSLRTRKGIPLVVLTGISPLTGSTEDREENRSR